MKNIYGNNLKYLLDEMELQNKDLAKHLCVSEQTVSGYTTNKHTMSAENLVKTADYLKCSTDFILGRVNSPYVLTGTKEELELLNLIKQMDFNVRKNLISLIKSINQNNK